MYVMKLDFPRHWRRAYSGQKKRLSEVGLSEVRLY